MEIMEKYFKYSKYIKIYFEIILNAKSQNRKKLKKSDTRYIYFERHHILPKSLYKDFGNLTENEWNSSLLTAREHFICHILLWKHFKFLKDKNAEIKMAKALQNLKTTRNINSKKYELYSLNLSHSEQTKKLIGQKSSEYMKNRSDEIKLATKLKLANTMSKIDENGLTKMQNSHLKQVHTSKNTILENGLTIEQFSQFKRVCTMKLRGSNSLDKNSTAKYYFLIFKGIAIGILWKQDIYSFLNFMGYDTKNNRIDFNKIDDIKIIEKNRDEYFSQQEINIKGIYDKKL